MYIPELGEILQRSRQSLWLVRAASCGANTCPPPDGSTTLRLLIAATNAILMVEQEMRERTPGNRSFTPLPRGDLPYERASLERLAEKVVLEIEELERNAGVIVKDMVTHQHIDDPRRLDVALTTLAHAVISFRVALGAALLAVHPA